MGCISMGRATQLREGPVPRGKQLPRGRGSGAGQSGSALRSSDALSFCQGEQAELVLPTAKPFLCHVYNQTHCPDRALHALALLHNRNRNYS